MVVPLRGVIPLALAALAAASSLNVPLPLTGLVQQELVALLNDDKGDWDHSGIVTFTERAAQIEIK